MSDVKDGQDSSASLTRIQKKKQEDLRKADEAEDWYKQCVSEANVRQLELVKTKKHVLVELRQLIYQCDQTMKAVSSSMKTTPYSISMFGTKITRGIWNNQCARYLRQMVIPYMNTRTIRHGHGISQSQVIHDMLLVLNAQFPMNTGQCLILNDVVQIRCSLLVRSDDVICILVSSVLLFSSPNKLETCWASVNHRVLYYLKVTCNFFHMMDQQSTPAPIRFQCLEESSRAYEPGSQFSDFVYDQLTSSQPTVDRVFAFEAYQPSTSGRSVNILLYRHSINRFLVRRNNYGCLRFLLGFLITKDQAFGQMTFRTLYS